MAQSFDFREQAARCQRLARDCTDIDLRDRLLGFSEEYTARAEVLEATGEIIRTASADDQVGLSRRPEAAKQPREEPGHAEPR